MNKTKIDWADYTWNPVTGCLNGCKYCYARNIANRFKGYTTGGIGCFEQYKEEDGNNHVLGEYLYRAPKEFVQLNMIKAPYPFGFDPTFHKYRLDEPLKLKKPSTIFVSSMGELFGDWVPDEWIQQVLDACRKAPQHIYLFLTKNPERYQGLIPSANMYFGTTINTNSDMEIKGCELFCHPENINTFLSIEPILEEIKDYRVQCFDWVIIGAETGNRKDKVAPKKEWIQNIYDYCAMSLSPVFMKDSIKELMGDEFVQEFPQSFIEKLGSAK